MLSFTIRYGKWRIHHSMAVSVCPSSFHCSSTSLLPLLCSLFHPRQPLIHSHSFGVFNSPNGQSLPIDRRKAATEQASQKRTRERGKSNDDVVRNNLLMYTRLQVGWLSFLSVAKASNNNNKSKTKEHEGQTVCRLDNHKAMRHHLTHLEAIKFFWFFLRVSRSS